MADSYVLIVNLWAIAKFRLVNTNLSETYDTPSHGYVSLSDLPPWVG